ncbi:response regulator transcription factor [Spirillospora albida]|uniref:response regulator transcription factor n=1 Tax=Spirillospora albida TaxID=58123 RepID=UPI0004C0EC35|nr:helix-turn-helix transcriptional regulator [Spirillospora albida]
MINGGTLLHDSSDPTELTVRELEVLIQIANGMDYSEIGRRLCISPRTVKHHTASMFRKLEARNRAHLIAIAFRSNYLR